MAQDITVEWRYRQRGNMEDFDFVTATESQVKSPTFRDYEVEVRSKATEGAAYTLRRTDAVTVEQYTYTQAMNIADAGSFMPFVRFVVRIRETTGYVSPDQTIDVQVVS